MDKETVQRHLAAFDTMLDQFSARFSIGDVVTACAELIAEGAHANRDHVTECRAMICRQAGYDAKAPAATAMLVLIETVQRLNASTQLIT